MTSTPTPRPVRCAAVDVGTNAIRFLAVEFVGPGRWVELEARRAPIRLGHDALRTGRLQEAAMDATVEAMAGFRKAMDAHGVLAYRAVATSAVRESRNGDELVRRVRRDAGIRLEPIDGGEEARLVTLAVARRVDLGSGPWVLADLGGGSLEVSLVSAEGIEWTETHRMGTVRLLEELASPGGDADDFRAMISERAGTLRIREITRGLRLRGLVVTGGNIEALAGLAGRTPDRSGVSRLPLHDLRRIVTILDSLGIEERMERLRLGRDRADVILPAALVYELVAVLTGLDTFVVPHVGVKEGILLDVWDDLADPGVGTSRRERPALEAALELGRRFAIDERHGRQVARLAASLFDQLQPLHGLGRDDRSILVGAAALHDVGRVVSHRKHHKHSLYLILNAGVAGFGTQELLSLALVARYHRRAEPRKGHLHFRDLDGEGRARVRRLASILRIADALDHGHLQEVDAVRASVAEGRLRLEVRGRGALLRERRALRRKSRMFERVFGLSVDVHFDDTNTVDP